MLHQLERTFFRERQHIRVQIPKGVHRGNGHTGVGRHGKRRGGFLHIMHDLRCFGQWRIGRCFCSCTRRDLICHLQVIQQFQRRKSDRRCVTNVMELADRKRRSGQWLPAVFQHAAIQHLGRACVIDCVINAAVCTLRMNVLLVVHHVEFFRFLLWLLLRGLRWFQRNSAFFTDFLEMLLNTGDEFAGCFSDGIQTCPERFHVLIL